MEEKPNLHKRILGIMSELDYIAKGEKTVNGQYRFVSHDQVTAKIHPLLVKHGVNIIPSTEEVTQEGNRTMVKLMVGFVNVDDPNDNFTTRWVGYGIDSSDKGPGKAISYAYKYALLKTFCLETGDDPDNDINVVYEAAKCLEFDSIIPEEFSDKDKAKLNKFLVNCAESAGKHIEDIKRQAVTRPKEFLTAFKNWNPKKGE